MSLTEQRERFCLEYVQDYNATQAAVRAGYSEDTARSQGSRLLTKVDIQRRVRELGNASAEELGITKRWLLTKLKESVEINTPHVEIAYAADGRPVAIGLGNATAMNRALELLMKHSGHLTDRIEVLQMPDTGLVREWVEALEADVAGTT